jgi:hypothetical protein
MRVETAAILHGANISMRRASALQGNFGFR